MSSSTVVRRIDRKPGWVGSDGADQFTRREDDITGYTWNLERDGTLESGETVSSVAYVDSGLTRSSVSNTTTSITFNSTGIGETEVTATLSTGRKVQRVVRYLPMSGTVSQNYEV